MDDLPETARLTPGRARRRRLIGRALGLTVLVLIALGALWGRNRLAAPRRSAALARGAAAFDRALAGKRAAWATVDAAYTDAIRTSWLDHYPVFALEVAHAVRAAREGRPGSTVPGRRQILDALARGDLATARRAAARLDDVTASAAFARLIADLKAARDVRVHR